MCDTVVATGSATADGVTIFGKNSDREPNEAHHILSIPAADHAPGSRVTCTYVDIPQVEHTYGVLLAKPFWIWGAEMGANEQGVVIGNEAVFTKMPYEKGAALIGMDFIRLALERAATARDALTVITDLLETYGQGGNCGFHHPMYYHNSFILADSGDAWVLETAGKQWAAQQVKGIRTISNGITIGQEWDLASADLVNHAIERGWCKSRDDFHFGRCYSDFLYTRFSDCHSRQCRTTDLLTAQQNNVTIQDVMFALRDHGETAWTPDKGLTGAKICMHAGFGPVRGSQTTGSMVAYLHPDQPTYFLTGSAAPCTSIFKPLWMDVELPDMGAVPSGTYDAASLFWRHETLHRATLRDYTVRISLYQDERNALEKQFIDGALACLGSPARGAYAAACFAEAEAAESRWTDRVLSAETVTRPAFLHQRAWQNFNHQAGLSLGKK